MTEVAKRCLSISYERTKEDGELVKRYSAYALKTETGLPSEQIYSVLKELYDLGFISKTGKDGSFYISPDGSAYAEQFS